MPSSTRVFKANKVFGSDSSSKIDTQFIEEAVADESSEEEKVASKVQQSKEKSQTIIDKAELEAQRLMQEAKEEAQKIKEQAETNGFKEGKDTGYQEGLEQGQMDGLEQAQKENQELKDNIMVMIKQTQMELEQYKKDNKENIITLASHMAEKIIHKQIDHSDEGILLLAEPYLYQLEKDEEFVTITVHPAQKEILEEQKADIESISPNTRFMILSDPNIEQQGLIIESSKAVIDLQIKKQIDTMLREFEEMERTVDA